MNWMLRFPSTEHPVHACSLRMPLLKESHWSTHELDVAFSINGKFFWVEAKSSSRSIDYGKYASLCEKLKVTSDRLLLVNSDLSVEECEGVSYFWNYRVANCATITGELENMVAKQIETAGKAVPSTD